MRRRKPTRAFWSAYRAIYDTRSSNEVQIELPIGSCAGEKKKAVKNDCPKESYEQIVAVNRIKKLGIVVHHSPNGGKRDGLERNKFARMGTMNGYPDLTMLYARKGYHGLFIEVKRLKGSKLSEEQIWWGDFLKAGGYAWYEAKGADKVMKIVYDYFDLNQKEE